jgi:hypothetical protein
MCRESPSESRFKDGLRTDECDPAVVVAELAAHEKVAQTEAERLSMGEPPIDGPPLRLDAVTPAELD